MNKRMHVHVAVACWKDCVPHCKKRNLPHCSRVNGFARCFLFHEIYRQTNNKSAVSIDIHVMEDSERNSHCLLDDRDWDRVAKFWSDMMLRSSLPLFVSGDPVSGYGLTDLKSIHDIGLEEYASKDPRFKRRTFALRIGYDGSKYNGYQMQKGNSLTCNTHFLRSAP